MEPRISMKKKKYYKIETLGDVTKKDKLYFKYELLAIDESYMPCGLGDFILHLNNFLVDFDDEGFENISVEALGQYEYTYLAIVGEKVESDTDYKKRLDTIGKKEELAKEKRRKAYEELKKEFS